MTGLASWRLAAVLGVVLLLGGCAGLAPAPAESPSLHVLEARALDPAGAKRDLVVEVSAPHAWPGFDTPRMAYVRRPYELGYFARSEWADAPARMLGPILARALEQTGSFRAVVQPPSLAQPDLRVLSELVRLQQNFTAHPSRVELAMRVELVEVRGRRVLASRQFEEAEDAPSEDAYGGVRAANAALQRLLVRIADFCVVESGRPR